MAKPHMSVPTKKKILARLLDVGLLNHSLLRLQKLCFRPFIRAVNYHAVPASHAEQFERHLRFYRKHFCPVSYADLLALHRGQWTEPKPGLIICFDDGLHDNAEVAGPLLERHGFIGWFFIPTGFLDTPPEQQMDFVQAHQISAQFVVPGNRPIAMSWDQLRELAKHHVVGCHTCNHRRLAATLNEAAFTQEILGAKQRLEEVLGCEVPVFAWVGGEEWSYSRQAAQAIVEAGFKVSFMSNSSLIRPGANLLQLQRTHIECSWHDYIVRFQLSGFMDLVYTAKRRRVNRLTKVT